VTTTLAALPPSSFPFASLDLVLSGMFPDGPRLCAESRTLLYHYVLFLLGRLVSSMRLNRQGMSRRLSPGRDARADQFASRDVQSAVRQVFPGELVKHAVSEGTKAVTRLFSSGMNLNGRVGPDMHHKAGLIVPLPFLHRALSHLFRAVDAQQLQSQQSRQRERKPCCAVEDATERQYHRPLFDLQPSIHPHPVTSNVRLLRGPQSVTGHARKGGRERERGGGFAVSRGYRQSLFRPSLRFLPSLPSFPSVSIPRRLPAAVAAAATVTPLLSHPAQCRLPPRRGHPGREETSERGGTGEHGATHTTRVGVGLRAAGLNASA
jgi:hypothetical protein